MNSQSESKNENKQDYWRQQIHNWKNSGLSQKQYCLTNSLALSTFCYWKSRLNNSKPALPQFYPLTIPPQTPKSSDAGLKLFVGQKKFQIEIKKNFSCSTLQKLITALEQL